MSIIVIKGIPLAWNMRGLLLTLASKINGQLEGMCLKIAPNQNEKICHLKVSSTLDPARVVEQINSTQFKNVTLSAYIPESVPHFTKKSTKLSGTKSGLLASKPEEVLLSALKEILIEMQCKFTSLYSLAKANTQLIPDIARTIYQRLKVIMDTNPQSGESSFTLTRAYRKMHPHFGDFQLILSTLHKLQDSVGAPRQQLVESELCKPPANPYLIDNVPLDLVKASYLKHSSRISKKMVDHIKSLKSDINPEIDSLEEKARKKVRAELKKLAIYVPWIIKQAVVNHIMPEKSPIHRVRMYGEPMLPKDQLLSPLIKKLGAFRVSRSNRIYNMLQFNVQPAKYDLVMAQDGVVISGAKLIFRNSDVPVFEVPKQLKTEIRAAFGVYGEVLEVENMDVDEDDDFLEEL